nr:tRNA lysidine(34) synthetase TilS [Dethiosulfovibrio faecalis]
MWSCGPHGEVLFFSPFIPSGGVIKVRRCSEKLGKTLHRAGVRQGWWDAKRIAVAVSGGSDSMALLWLMLNCWPNDISVIHVEHGIRGDSSKADACFVKEHCEKLDIPCCVVSRNVPGEAMKGESLEQAARRIRHEALASKAEEIGSDFVALAHNSDDTVETFFLNLARGSGAYGLAGIPEVRDRFVRPVLEISRDELRELLKEVGWSWVEDESNQEDIYLRNRIRHEVLPLLEKRINSGVRRHVLSLIEEMSDLRREEERTASDLSRSLFSFMPWSLYSLDRSGVMDLSKGHRIWLFRHVGRELGLRTLSRHRTEILSDLLERSSRWRFQWSEDVELCCCKDHLIWLTRESLEERSSETIVLSLTRGESEWFGEEISWSCLEEGIPFREGLVANVPVLPKDGECLIDVVPLSSIKNKEKKAVRGSFPWCIENKIPVVRINGIPYWSPRIGNWFGRWVFPLDSVKCDGVCSIRFTHPRQG